MGSRVKRKLSVFEKQNRWAVRAKELFINNKALLKPENAKKVEHYLTEEIRNSPEQFFGSIDAYLDYFFQKDRCSEYPLIRACVRGFCLRELDTVQTKLESRKDSYFRWNKDNELLSSINKGNRLLKKYIHIKSIKRRK